MKAVQTSGQLLAARALFKTHLWLSPIIETAFEAAALNLKDTKEFVPSQFIRSRIVVDSLENPSYELFFFSANYCITNKLTMVWFVGSAVSI